MNTETIHFEADARTLDSSTQADHVIFHGRAFSFEAVGLSAEGFEPEAGLDWLHCWLAGHRPAAVDAVHVALIEAEGLDREGLVWPELDSVDTAEAHALFLSNPDRRPLGSHQTFRVRALRPH